MKQFGLNSPGLSYQQGFRSRSSTEYSLMRKYHLYLLISVLFIFLLTTTYLALFRDLADTPAKVNIAACVVFG